MVMMRGAALLICCLASACGPDAAGSRAATREDRYVQNASDQKLYARDARRQAARTVIVETCSATMKKGVGTAGGTVSDAAVADACGCVADQRTRPLTTQQIEAGEIGPDDGSCARWLQPAEAAADGAG